MLKGRPWLLALGCAVWVLSIVLATSHRRRVSAQEDWEREQQQRFQNLEEGAPAPQAPEARETGEASFKGDTFEKTLYTAFMDRRCLNCHSFFTGYENVEGKLFFEGLKQVTNEEGKPVEGLGRSVASERHRIPLKEDVLFQMDENGKPILDANGKPLFSENNKGDVLLNEDENGRPYFETEEKDDIIHRWKSLTAAPNKDFNDFQAKACTQCHSISQWRAPRPALDWTGKGSKEVCNQITSRFSKEEIQHHLTTDPLILWAVGSGEIGGRLGEKQVDKGPNRGVEGLEDWLKRVNAWVDSEKFPGCDELE